MLNFNIKMMMTIDDEIERIIPTVRMNCAMSGGCKIYKTGNRLTCTMGDEEIMFLTHEDGIHANVVREKLRRALE